MRHARRWREPRSSLISHHFPAATSAAFACFKSSSSNLRSVGAFHAVSATAIKQPMPPVITLNGALNKRGDQARFQLAQLRPAHEEDHIDGRHAAAQLIGRHHLPDRLAQDHADRVRRRPSPPASTARSTNDPRQAKQHRRQTVDRHRPQNHRARLLRMRVMKPIVPPAINEPIRDAAVKQPIPDRAHLQNLRRKDRQQLIGRREERGEEIEQHRGADDRLAKDEAQALLHRTDRGRAA